MSTAMIWQTVSISSADTERLGELLGQNLKAGQTIELRSDLGGGKTTFVRGLVHGLGSKDTVASPTFTLNKIYKTKNALVHHYDFYRLNDPGILADQLAESLQDQSVITVIEWSDIVQDILPAERVVVKLRVVETDPDERDIEFSYPESMSELIKRIKTEWSL